MSNKYLSLNDFKNWIGEQKELVDFFNLGLDKPDTNDELIGNKVKSKVGEEKLLERIEPEGNMDAETLVEEFLEEGGTVLGIEEKKVLVEVESGSFYIPRFCVKIKKSS